MVINIDEIWLKTRYTLIPSALTFFYQDSVHSAISFVFLRLDGIIH